jgi:3-methyladenine DNA glycosylase AlkD
MQYDEVIARLKELENPVNVAGMARFGIRSKNTLGISIVELRKIARGIKKNHVLALQLWDSGIHEARILAGFVDDPAKVTEAQLDEWVKDFDSWDIVDQVAALIYRTPFVLGKIDEWSESDAEFVKRTAFTLIAEIACHDKKMTDADFEPLLKLIKKAATDERNYVKKAVNWALRGIGKRNQALNKRAMTVAREIQKIDSKSARWIAADALKELTGEAVQKRLAAKWK